MTHGRNIVWVGLVVAAVIPACASEVASTGNPVIALPDASNEAADSGGTTLSDAELADTTGDDASGDDTTDASLSDDASADAPSNEGAAGDAVAECVPTPLACDGLAHDCDGVVDKGCPSFLVYGAPSNPSAGWGGTGGSAFTDPCPGGEVLVGMTGKVSAYIDQIAAICGTVVLVENSTVTPHTYSVSISSTNTMTTRGIINTGTTWTSRCGQDEVVVGAGGRSGGGLDAISLKCAKLLILGSPGSFEVKEGPVDTLPTQGGTGGTAFADFMCGINQVVRTMAGRAGNSIDQLSLVCDTATVSVK